MQWWGRDQREGGREGGRGEGGREGGGREGGGKGGEGGRDSTSVNYISSCMHSRVFSQELQESFLNPYEVTMYVVVVVVVVYNCTPPSGAKEGGLWGLVKGTGKGVIGLVVRPTAGVFDLASATLNTIQKYVYSV